MRCLIGFTSDGRLEPGPLNRDISGSGFRSQDVLHDQVPTAFKAAESGVEPATSPSGSDGDPGLETTPKP